VAQQAQAAQVPALVQTQPQAVQLLPIAVVVVVVLAGALKPVAQEVRVLLWWPIQNHRNSQVVPLATWVALWYTHLPRPVT
jgi:hypothetical protein